MNWIDIVIAVFCLIGLIGGIKDGFIKSVSKLIALAVGIWAAIRFSDFVTKFFMTKFPKLQEAASQIPSQVINIIAFILVFVVVILVINLIGKMLDKVSEMAALKGVNKLLGAIFGILKWTLIFSLLIYVLNIFNLANIIIPEKTRNESFLYEHVEKIVPKISDMFVNKKTHAPTEDVEA
ncbi:MAG: CvpA family protein [Bacteroidales bacterium]|nr:CvpA family protein [Bacteroidales bacterium]